MENRIQQLQQYIRENLHLPLNRKILADVACMSPVHLDRSFKASSGLTPALYLEIHRIKESLELLQEEHQVQDVAFQLGFANYETFSRAFKKHCSIAPSDLQYLLHKLAKESDPQKPMLLSKSGEQQDLLCLAKEAMKFGKLSLQQLNELQICIIQPTHAGFRTRKTEEKYRLSLEPNLAIELRSALLA